MRDVAQFIEKAKQIYGYEHFINDAGGSICELNDEQTIQILADSTLILYLSADEAMEQKLIERAIDNPKPMYYQEAFLDRQLSGYLAERIWRTRGTSSRMTSFADLPSPGGTSPSLYEAVADAHGYTLDARAAERVDSEAAFLRLVADTLG